MTVIIKPIDKAELIFEDVESIDDDCYPLIKIRHKNHNAYVMMSIPENCYLLVINEDE